MSATSTRADEILALGPWFHNLHLPDGSQTCPDHWLGDFPSFKWREVQACLPTDLHGWTCLDIGCNAGFYSFELARRGATVTGIDHDERYLAQARWAARQMNQPQVRFEHAQVYDLARWQAQFDLVLFMGVFYHLRHPLLGLDLACRCTRRLMLFQTLTAPSHADALPPVAPGWDQRDMLADPGWPKMSFLEKGLAGDPTNVWAPDRAACLAMLRSAGMRVIAEPAHEFFLCQPDGPSSAARDELHAVFGGQISQASSSREVFHG